MYGNLQTSITCHLHEVLNLTSLEKKSYKGILMETRIPGVGTITIFFVTEIQCANLDNSEISAEDLAMQNSGEEA